MDLIKHCGDIKVGFKNSCYKRARMKNQKTCVELLVNESDSYLKLRLCSLHTVSQYYLDRARDLVNAGRKDEARSWLRFFQDATVVQICAHAEFVTSESKQKFAAELLLLETECHSLDA